MAAKYKEGDAVQIAARDAVSADTKSGLYFAHYANLKGTILKLYGEEASILVDRETLPTDIRARHDEGEKAMRQKWLDGLSEEGRNRLNSREKQFTLNYAVLVSLNDVTHDKSRPKADSNLGIASASPEANKEAEAVGASVTHALNPLTGESDVADASPDASEPGESGTDSATKRVSAQQLDANEAARLAESAKKQSRSRN